MSNSSIFIAVASYEHPVGKAVYIKENKIQRKKHLDRTERGNIHLMEFVDLEAYAEWVQGVTPDTMRLCGTIAPEHDGHRIAYKAKPGEFLPVGSISLTNEYLAFRKQGGIVSIDTDYKSAEEVLGLWPEVHEFQTHEELRSVLLKAMPELEGVAMLMRDSSSSFTFSSNDVQLTGRRGIHTDIWIDDASKTPEVIDLLHARLWAMGYGWLFVSKGARIEERSPVDRVMARPHQPDFIRAFFPDDCGYSKPEFSLYTGVALKASELKPLTSEQKRLYASKLAEGHEALAGALATAKTDKILSIKRELVERGTNPRLATRLAEQAIEGGVLERDFILNFKQLGPVSVSELVTDGKRFDKQALDDPLEPDYAASVIFYWNEGRNPQIHSFAHGGRLYKLKPSAYDYVGRVKGVTNRLAADIEKKCEIYRKKFGVDGVFPHIMAGYISQAFWDPTKSKFFMLNRDHRLNLYSKNDFASFELKHGYLFVDRKAFDDLPEHKIADAQIDAIATVKLTDKQRAKILDLIGAPAFGQAAYRVSQDIIEYIVTRKQATEIQPEVDMFVDRPALERTADGIIRYIRPHTEFKTNWGVDNETIERVVIDYREHFPEFDDWLDMLAAARFASSRRRAFNWLQCVSDWGKGLLEGAINALDLVLKISPDEIEAAMAGKPTGLDLTKHVGAWILWVDEFKAVKRELKQINESISGAGKKMMRATIPTYLKMFTSAETVGSLIGDAGVEEQFANRFTHIRGGSRIDDRPVFNTIGQDVYRNALSCYIANRLNEKVATYRRLGREGAAREAQKVLEAAHKRWAISNGTVTLRETVERVAEEFSEYVRSVVKDREYRYKSKAARLIQESIIGEAEFEGETWEVACIQGAKKVLKLFLEDRYTPDEVGKVSYKAPEILLRADMFCQGPHQHRIRVKGESVSLYGCFIALKVAVPNTLPKALARIPPSLKTE